MYNILSRFHFSIPAFLTGTVVFLAVVYLGLIAVIMNYAALTIEFSQSVRNDEAAVATLEAQYLAAVSRITTTDYAAAGYAKPIAVQYVSAANVAALH